MLLIDAGVWRRPHPGIWIPSSEVTTFTDIAECQWMRTQVQQRSYFCLRALLDAVDTKIAQSNSVDFQTQRQLIRLFKEPASSITDSEARGLINLAKDLSVL